MNFLLVIIKDMIGASFFDLMRNDCCENIAMQQSKWKATVQFKMKRLQKVLSIQILDADEEISSKIIKEIIPNGLSRACRRG